MPSASGTSADMPADSARPEQVAVDPIALRRLKDAMTAMRDGIFSGRLEPVDGPLGDLASVHNEIAERLSHLTDELARVRREAGRDGHHDERLRPSIGGGTWAGAVEDANNLVADLARPTAEVARVVAAVSAGDLTQTMAVRHGSRALKGDPLLVAKSVNGLVTQLATITEEIARVTREVGTEGKLGGRARVRNASGTWRDLVDAVNTMSSKLTAQVRDIAEVTTAVANGDLSRTVTIEVSGEMAQLKDTVDRMVSQLSSFAAEVTRVAREVGTEGRLGGQADVRGVSGTWRDLTDSVNTMASNLTSQVRGISSVAKAVALGDLSQQITVTARGEVAELAETLNSMTATLQTFADEVTRVAREVGTEGILGGQAEVPGVAGRWKDLTDSVNSMASNLTNQVRDIAQVTTAVAGGDLSQKITVDVRGELAELKTTVNTMVDQLSAFADEVTRVAREVGTDGKLGGQAEVPGVGGRWKDLTDSVNSMATNLTNQVRNIAQVTTAVAGGDLSQKITVDVRGELAELKTTVNTMVDQLSSFADEVTRVAREVGGEGQLGGQAAVPGVSGTWRDLTDSVNFMAGTLTAQVRNIAQVTTAVARGDLSRQITVDARGEILELKSTINTMVDQLSSFAAEVTRVAREVGTEGRLGGQADVHDVSGTWKDLTDSVNSMASNLTSQVRNIAQVTTAVARGDLTQKITVDARGEILELKSTINTMVDQLGSFADEVTRVAREVGTEGKLGGQAEVADVSGTWRGLTENVNQLALTLTTQLRAIAEVSAAVTQGDLSRQITVGAAGEVADLKDNLNEMIDSLRETTRANEDQDWLKTNLARFTGHMQGGRDLLEVARLIVSELTPLVGAQQGSIFLTDQTSEYGGPKVLRRIASYGYQPGPDVPDVFAVGEGLVGQAAYDRQPIIVRDVPADFLRISSGHGSAAPTSIVVLPVVFEEKVIGVVELASFRPFSTVHMQFLEQLAESIGVSLNAIMASSRTEELLVESQRLAAELQDKQDEGERQQVELQQSNAALEEKARQLADQNQAIEIKNLEIEDARRGLEERAEQLALSSRYKSEFLANMSHELRTPLNSLLILARLLSDNVDGNLNSRQVEYSRTIHGAGTDLLQLINDILDLSKVEAGKMDVHVTDVAVTSVVEYVEATFRPLTAEKDLDFIVSVDPDVPRVLRSDQHRLQQVLRNLLSNAVKFTDGGGVRLLIRNASGERFSTSRLQQADSVLAFSVVDTGIGIPPEKLRVIFEAFQQADGTISRKFGGTGLGLSISREVAHLIGGEIQVKSEPGHGSSFTLYVPRISFETVDAQPATPAVDEQSATDRRADQVLLVLSGGSDESGPGTSAVVEALFGSVDEVETVFGTSPEEAQAVLADRDVDCVVLDLPPAEGGFDVLRWMRTHKRTKNIPVVLSRVGEVTKAEQSRLDRYTQAMTLRTPATTEEAIDDVSVLLGRPGPQPSRSYVPEPADPNGQFVGRRILIVDDDVRNVFALTSALEQHGIDVIYAESGEAGIEALQREPGVDLVLMDIMMPGMDGLTAMRLIRDIPQFKSLPMIALTAKAMTGDREDSLAAGASEYITKPVDVADLLSLFRLWLS
ncbi:HAMP domain-containing protein [Nocardioides sp. NPDC057577]|uniref:HAMP domain-containing protein n=1 Tax=Nocardioides sp. NPDC057577 TaxID=3346171 RepID=UPI00366C22F9